jgi:ankyrin repeat protein
LNTAATKRDFELVKFFVEKGANNWNWGLIGAAHSGDLELVEFFISKGASEWDRAMMTAASRGHLDLVKFFVGKQFEKGVNLKDKNSWTQAFFAAKDGAHPEIAEYLRNLR